jgi:diguanylate cyclase (GGDEF)-like protein/PAS domain S-box-containing protein
MTPRPLRALILGNNAGDAQLIVRQLQEAGFDPTSSVVDTETDYLARLSGDLDIILADDTLPQFDALRALEALKERDLDVPLIIVSGTTKEEAALAAVRSGAKDFLYKSGLSRIGFSVEREIRASAERRAIRAAYDAAQRLAAIVESSDDAIYGTGLDWKIFTWNAGAERLFGYSAQEAIGQCIDVLYPTDRRAELAEYQERAASGARIQATETVRIRKDGQRVDVSIAVSPIKDAVGRVTAFSSIVRGIGERKRAEEAVRQLAAIVESSNDAIMSAAPDGTVLSWNAAAERLLGYSAADMVGQSLSILAPPDRSTEFREMMQKVRGAERLYQYETVRRRKSGEAVDVSVSISPIQDGSGETVAFSAIMRDITERTRAEAAVRESEIQYRRIVETAREGVWLVDAQGRTTFANRRIAEMLGCTVDEMMGASMFTFMDDEGKVIAGASMERRRKGIDDDLDFKFIRKDGSELWAYISTNALLDESGAYRGSLAMVTDITARRLAEEGLRESEQRFKSMFFDAAVGQLQVMPDGRWSAVNRAFCEMTGYDEAELLAKGWLAITHPDDVDVGNDQFTRLLAGEIHYFQLEKRYLRKDGTVLWVVDSVSSVFGSAGQLKYLVIQAQDITARKQAQEALAHQTFHDALTGLPNRLLLEEHLERELESARKSSRPLALLMIDLDHFKEVNDTFGHQVGDLLLRQVGLRLRSQLRQREVVARLGGDEFGVLLPQTDRSAAMALGERLLEALDRPFDVEGQPLDVAASIGASSFPTDGGDANVLLRRADIAMFVAKRSRGTVVAYAAEYERHDASRLTLMAELRGAIADDQLILHYQPLVSLRDGSVTRLEALVRWEHPQRGVIPPAEFIPFAEKTRLIRPLTDWVLRTALRQCRTWHASGQVLPMAVNISMRDLVDPELPSLIGQMLKDCEADPTWLGLEISEGVIMADPDRAIDTLRRLRKLGIRIAVDDFGTGYSSLAYLHRLPVDEIKIDRSFIMRMTSASSNIVRAAVDLSHSLRFETVAEGVEDERTWDLLNALGCDTAQGFFICRPMGAENVPPWLAGWALRQKAAPDSRQERSAA